MDDATHILGNEKRVLARMLTTAHDAEDEGDDIGPYRLIECIGEGGFGMVWRAEQTEPVQRQVALKIIKRGMDTGQVLARFDYERQALASMDHPGIAAMLDAGASADGRPWFAMELVQGQPITDWCAARDASIADRLRLFTLVCQAVQHAHQKGLIHRDLKPSNILVTVIDGEPVPKVIDFGIAKAVRATALMMHGTLTQADQIIGTPVYMSPEQIEGARVIDTRSDIYSLGVLLYELLTGEPPFAPSNGIEALRQSIRQDVPAKPTSKGRTRQKGRKGLPPTESRLSFESLRSFHSSDLDIITLRALEKDPARRYATALELAEDVQRFLDDEPIHARPPSFSYVTGRWIKRHRVIFTAACAVVAAMVAATIISLHKADVARAALHLAENETDRATHQEKRAMQTSAFVTDLLDRVTDQVGKGRNPEALKLALDGSGERIAVLTSDPDLRVELLGKISDIYGTIGEHREHIPLLKTYADEIAKLRGPASEEAFTAELEYCKQVMDHGERGTAPPLVLDLRGRVESAGMNGSKLWFEVQRAVVRSWLKLKDGPHALAEAEFLVDETKRSGASKNTLATHQINIVMALELTGDFDRAEAILADIRAYAAKAKNTKRLKEADDALLHVLWSKKDHARAAAMIRERLPAQRTELGAKSPAFAAKLVELSTAERDAGEFDHARAHAAEAVTIMRGNADKRGDLFNAVYAALKVELAAVQPGAALPLATEALALARAEGNSDHVRYALTELGKLLRDNGELDKAEKLFEEHIALTIEAQANTKSLVEAMKNLCVNQTRQSRRPEAMRTAQQMWDRLITDPALMQNKDFVADIADHALHSYLMLRRLQPNMPEPPDLATWKEAAKGATNGTLEP
ncbi:MAG: serine/threonine-protein kinase [Verrucomicrobiaceae bacterium]|nr:serine/threonine-protein kinase [Verrucomicrobiaceae bacterium]